MDAVADRPDVSFFLLQHPIHKITLQGGRYNADRSKQSYGFYRKATATGVVTRSRAGVGDWVAACGALLIQYGLVLVVGWIGIMKFTTYEATGIQPLVAHSPLLS